MRNDHEGISAQAVYGAAAGFLLGAAAVLWALREAARAEEAGEEKPSWASRLLAKIPLRVKLAAVAGAVKGGGGSALHVAGEKLAARSASHRPVRARSSPRR